MTSPYRQPAEKEIEPMDKDLVLAQMTGRYLLIGALGLGALATGNCAYENHSRLEIAKQTTEANHAAAEKAMFDSMPRPQPVAK